MTTNRGALYAEARGRITELVRAASSEELERRPPGTPDWTVRDVVAHLAGVTADVAAGNIEGAATDPWTAKQVADRQGSSLEALLEEWEKHAPGLESVLDLVPEAARALADITTHEQDVAAALGRESGRGSDSYDAGLQLFLASVDSDLRSQGRAALRVRAGDQEWLLGDGEPVASVDVDPHELFRALAGRRSEAQIKAWAWDADPGPSARAISVLGPSSTDVTE